MINLLPGQYQGAASGIISANGLLIGFTDYVLDQSVSCMHTHENAHVSMGLTGQVAVYRKSHSGVHANIEKCSFVHAGEEHQTVLVSARAKHINLELEQQFFHRYELKEEQVSRITAAPGASLLMLKLFKELHFSGSMQADHIHSLILSMLTPQLHATKISTPPWVQVVKELLADNWDKEITLPQIAFTAGLHPVTVSRYFMRYFGCSLGEYRRGLKIERALQLMNTTNQSFTEIAYSCAFFDQSHFIRAFKEATGYSPKQFIKGMSR